MFLPLVKLIKFLDLIVFLLGILGDPLNELFIIYKFLSFSLSVSSIIDCLKEGLGDSFFKCRVSIEARWEIGLR